MQNRPQQDPMNLFFEKGDIAFNKNQFKKAETYHKKAQAIANDYISSGKLSPEGYIKCYYVLDQTSVRLLSIQTKQPIDRLSYPYTFFEHALKLLKIIKNPDNYLASIEIKMICILSISALNDNKDDVAYSNIIITSRMLTTMQRNIHVPEERNNYSMLCNNVYGVIAMAVSRLCEKFPAKEDLKTEQAAKLAVDCNNKIRTMIELIKNEEKKTRDDLRRNS